MQILTVLAHHSFGVLELCQIFSIKQSSMSHHLKVLANAQLVSTRREGNTIFYRRNIEALPPALHELRDAIYRAADTAPLEPDFTQNLNAIFSSRAEASRRFFIEHAGDLRQQQDLIAEFDRYGPEVARLLPQRSQGQALEVGPGEGDFLPTLSARFHKVVAVDTSESMLELCRQRCDGEGSTNVALVLDDTRYCHEHARAFDCVVVNMVLHHVPAPAAVISDLARALKRDGSLIICDLCAHDQDWVRETCGDRWLGFDKEDLFHWAERAGLQRKTSEIIALRNGFQIQIHQFTPT